MIFAVVDTYRRTVLSEHHTFQDAEAAMHEKVRTDRAAARNVRVRTCEVLTGSPHPLADTYRRT